MSSGERAGDGDSGGPNKVMTDPAGLIAEALDRLHSAGWSLGVAAFGSTDGSGRIVWQVDGRNGENFIRADGTTEAVGMLGAITPGEPGPG